MASRGIFRHISGVNWLDEKFLWASCVWGAIATGYLLYGRRQRAVVPLAAGGAMLLMSFIGPNALVMSLVCLGIIAVAWWLLRQGF